MIRTVEAIVGPSGNVRAMRKLLIYTNASVVGLAEIRSPQEVLEYD